MCQTGMANSPYLVRFLQIYYYLNITSEDQPFAGLVFSVLEKYVFECIKWTDKKNCLSGE